MNNEKAVVILGGSLKKDKAGRWRTTSFSEGDDFGTLGDRLRVIAGEYLYKEEDRPIFVLGGPGQLKDMGAPAVSETMKQELMERGVPAENIFIEVESGSTWQQLQELKRLIQEHALGGLTVISNEYHLPRIQAMIEKDGELNALLQNNQLKLESAESVLIAREPRWEKSIRSAYERDDVRARIALEQKGVEDINEGRYKFNRN